MSKYERLYKLAIQNILQIPTEIIPFMEYIDNEVKPKNFLEIGVCQGGTFFLWCNIAQPGGVKLGIDMPNGPWGLGRVRDDKEMATNKRMFESLAPNTFILYEDSSSDKSTDWVQDKLESKQLDFLFIDGDHSYEGVKSDYYKYLPLVKAGGIIAMHDIKNTPKHDEANCHVYKFWEELNGEKMEFVDNTVDWGGIGVIKVI